MTGRDSDTVSKMNGLTQPHGQGFARPAASRQAGKYCHSCGKPLAVTVEVCHWCGVRQAAFEQFLSYDGNIHRSAIRQEGSSTSSTTGIIAVGSGLAMVAGFFLPWIKIGTFGLDVHLSGWDLITLVNATNYGNTDQSGAAFVAFLLWCVLLAGLGGLGAAVWGVMSPKRRVAPWACAFMAGIAGLLPFVLVAIGLAGLSQDTQSGSAVIMRLASNMISVDMGVWVTIAGAVGLVAQACARFRHQEAPSPTAAPRQL